MQVENNKLCSNINKNNYSHYIRLIAGLNVDYECKHRSANTAMVSKHENISSLTEVNSCCRL